jgi:hypothetical protein
VVFTLCFNVTFLGGIFISIREVVCLVLVSWRVCSIFDPTAYTFFDFKIHTDFALLNNELLRESAII